ncbi:MAG: hypothetical protein J6K84_00290 [Oscillospiraceae bacterium]|nr:hypothetical protein [Oscillospiraceae bacterium]
MSKNECRQVKTGPALLLLLGACPALALSTTALSAVTAGAFLLAVTLLTSVTMALLKGLVAKEIKLAASVLVATGYTVLLRLAVGAWLPDFYYAHGDMVLYLNAIAVSPFVYRQAEHATENGFGKTVAESLLAGVCFLVSIVVVGAVREILGAATVFGKELTFMKDYTIALAQKPFGGFVVLALVAAVANIIRPNKCMDCKKGA